VVIQWWKEAVLNARLIVTTAAILRLIVIIWAEVERGVITSSSKVEG
jgi:hypothetical protein